MNKVLISAAASIATGLIMFFTTALAQPGDKGGCEHRQPDFQRLASELQLSDSQQTQFVQIMQAQHEKMQSLHQKQREAMQGVHAETLEKLGAVLDAQQLATFKEHAGKRPPHRREPRQQDNAGPPDDE